MDFVIVRTFDHTGYYETRLILLLISLSLAIYLWRAKQEKRYLVVFFNSALMMALMEYALQASGLRGPGYSFSLFGLTISRAYGPIIQGLLEGGICGLMALWFADLRAMRAKVKQWLPYLATCGLVAGLAILTGTLSRHRPISSVRPMFSLTPILIVTSIIFFSLLIAWRKDALSVLANYFAGLLVFSLINFEPLHLLGARYVGIQENLQLVPAGSMWQILMMTLSHIYESSGGKLHYFMIPFAFGLVALKEKAAEETARLSYQHLQALTQRGWRKKSKPFQR